MTPLLRHTAVLFGLAFVLASLYSCESKNLEEDFPVVCTDTAGFDSTGYTAHVRTVLLSYCMPCHSTQEAESGVVLDTYADAKAVGETGALVGVMFGQPGYPPMPDDGSRVPACDLERIRAWANNGFRP